MRLLLLTLLFGLLGCSQTDRQTGTLAGVLEGPVQLPAGSHAIVILEELGPADRAALRLAETSFVLEQQPFAFQLDYPLDIKQQTLARGHRLNLRARIESAGGELLWTSTQAHPVTQANDDYTIALQPMARSFARFECTDKGDDSSEIAEAEFGPEQLVLSFRQQHWQLAQQRSASGARYSAGAITFWEHDERASLELSNGERLSCKRLP